MLGLDTPEKYLIYLIRQYVLRTIKGINMTQEQFENKITGMKADTSRYFSELQLEETENLIMKIYITILNQKN